MPDPDRASRAATIDLAPALQDDHLAGLRQVYRHGAHVAQVLPPTLRVE